ncbi:pilin [Patescibacteria group bacterium]|nr:pilin [Patescibacteria group bacterium]MBU4511636.1 pilin [Patescibacteria group bacterium]MCG2692706.1 pilin [Candidatus Parcubacteria bacterium]
MFKDKLSKTFLLIIILLVVVQAGILLLVNTVYAADENAGLWWTKEECAKKCGELLAKEGKSPVDNHNFFSEGGCIDKDIGDTNQGVICLVPPPEVKLSVPLNSLETQTVRGIGDYIAKLIEWSIITLSILAVVMIMVAGFQWIAAAGNSATIGKAKSRIMNAIIGLVLALGSFVLLNTINPKLVEFEGVKVKMIPTIHQSAMWCKDLSLTESLTLKCKTEGACDLPQITIKKDDNKHDDIGSCGKEYVSTYAIEETRNITCLGNDCQPTGEKCLAKQEDEDYACVQVTIYGDLKGNKKVREIWAYAECEEEIKVLGVEGMVLGNGSSYAFGLNVIDLEEYCCKARGLEHCGGDSMAKGFFLGVLMEDNWDTDDWIAIDADGNAFLNEKGENVIPAYVSEHWRDEWIGLFLLEGQIDVGVKVDIDTTDIKNR